MSSYRDHILHYFKYFSFNRKVFPVNVQFIRSKLEYKIKTTVFKDIPIQMAEYASKLPYIGTKSFQDQVQQLKSA